MGLHMIFLGHDAAYSAAKGLPCALYCCPGISRAFGSSSKHSRMTFTTVFKSSSEITKGGARRILASQGQGQQDARDRQWESDWTHVFSCVGFAKTPLLAMSKHRSQAERPTSACFDSSISMALNKPLHRTAFTQPPLPSASAPTLFKVSRSSLKVAPSFAARSGSCSSTSTSSAAIATAQASGLPSKACDQLESQQSHTTQQTHLHMSNRALLI